MLAQAEVYGRIRVSSAKPIEFARGIDGFGFP